MSILDVFKTNRQKLAEQQQQINNLQAKIKGGEVEVDALADEKHDLKDKITAKEGEIHKLGKQIDKIQSQKKIEIEEREHQKVMHEQKLEHQVKIKIEALEIMHDKKVVELDRQKNEEVAEIRDEYRDKIEKNLEDRITDLKTQTDKVMEFIPKVESMVSISQGNQPAASKD